MLSSVLHKVANLYRKEIDEVLEKINQELHKI